VLALALAITAAVVVEDRAPMRAAPHDVAPRQAVLWRGDWLEVRGERAGFLQVYDHRHERPGYVRAAQVRSYPLDERSAPALHALVDWLRDAAGSESLGIGCAALYLRAAPAGQVDAGLFDALGVMADRLARRASASQAGAGDASLAAQLEVAESYGVRFASFERDGRTEVCYDGEAFRRVLAMGGDASMRQRAALALTRPTCADPAASPVEARAWNEWRLGVLDAVDPAALPPWLAGPLRLRRAEVLSLLAFQHARAAGATTDPGDGRARAAREGERAVQELALVARGELLDEDAAWYDETAVRVGAARWAAEPVRAPAPRGRLTVETAPGRPGETCVKLVDRRGAGDGQTQLERCTYGLVWTASARAAATGDALALEVQPLPGWAELWLFRRGADGWRLETLAPAPVDPGVGYVELAGFTPDGARLLVVREAQLGSGTRRSFQVLRSDTLAVEKQARSPELLVAFRRWASPEWRRATLALR
jgi:hypothetical protein